MFSIYNYIAAYFKAYLPRIAWSNRFFLRHCAHTHHIRKIPLGFFSFCIKANLLRGFFVLRQNLQYRVKTPLGIFSLCAKVSSTRESEAIDVKFKYSTKFRICRNLCHRRNCWSKKNWDDRDTSRAIWNHIENFHVQQHFFGIGLWFSIIN